MPLNLGNLTSEYSNMSTEELLLEAADAEIELTEMFHSMENLENAKTIQDLAKQSNSVECMRFAEELLGCSVEVQLPSATNGGLQQFRKLLLELIPKARRLISLLASVADEANKTDSLYKPSVANSIDKLDQAAEKIRTKTIAGIRRYGSMMRNTTAALSVFMEQMAGTGENTSANVKLLNRVVDYFEQLANNISPDRTGDVNDKKYMGMLKWGISTMRSILALGLRYQRIAKRSLKS